MLVWMRRNWSPHPLLVRVGRGVVASENSLDFTRHVRYTVYPSDSVPRIRLKSDQQLGVLWTVVPQWKEPKAPLPSSE